MSLTKFSIRDPSNPPGYAPVVDLPSSNIKVLCLLYPTLLHHYTFDDDNARSMNREIHSSWNRHAGSAEVSVVSWGETAHCQFTEALRKAGIAMGDQDIVAIVTDDIASASPLE